MTTAGRLPRAHLRGLPKPVRLAHEYCFFLHDETLRMLVEYEGARAHFVRHDFADAEQAQAYARLAETLHPIDAMRRLGLEAQARRVVLNQVVMAMTSDVLHHLYEGLRCLEKRKSIVALNLLRKPLIDNLLYLSWMCGDEDAFYEAFTNGGPQALQPKVLGNHRQDILAKAMAATEIAGLIDPAYVHETIFDAKNPYGLYRLFQHAVHLVTFDRLELRTEPENFNLIFKSPSDDDLYHAVYEQLPTLILFLAHVLSTLFDRMRPMDKGARTAFMVRSAQGYWLTQGGQAAEQSRSDLTKMLTANFRCGDCDTPLKMTDHNMARIILAETCRCTTCGTVSGFPVSWIF